MNKIFLLLTGLHILAAAPGFALSIEQPLPDAAQEQQARDLFGEVRCMVCQGESLADSGAEVAQDMRQMIRRKISAGETPDAIRAFLVERYGTQVLMTPPLNTATAILWFGPAIIFLLALAAAAFYFFHSGANTSKRKNP